MAGDKSWQMTGEVAARDRPVGSLLAEVLDFSLGTKLPPTITKETTNNLEAVIKQRILDELFDDPIRKIDPARKGKDDDDLFNFTKSKRGLGELYEDDYRKKALTHDPNAYLDNEFTGTDSAIKKEIDSIAKNLFY